MKADQHRARRLPSRVETRLADLAGQRSLTDPPHYALDLVQDTHLVQISYEP